MWNWFPVRALAVLCSIGCSAADPPARGAGAGGTTGGSNGGAGSAGAMSAGAAGGGSGGGAGAAAMAGAGGTAGVSGSAGASGGAGGAPSGAPCDAPGLFLCDDFESAPAGSFPILAGWLDNPCSSHVVDGTTGHGSSQSLRAEQLYNDCMVHADVTEHEDIYLRSWIKLGAPSSMSGHHIGLLELGSQIADDPELRIGIRDGDSTCAGMAGIDVTVGGLPIGEKTSCTGVSLEQDEWYCFEAHVQRDLPNFIRFSVWLDGAEIVGETSYEGLNADWDSGMVYFKFGRSSYGGNNEFPVWHDDIALGTSRIGCNQ